MQDRAKRRYLVIGMIGMPLLTDGASLISLFQDNGNLRLPLKVGEKAINIDVAPAPRKGEVLLRRK